MPAGLQVVNFFAQGIAGTPNEPLAPGTGDSATFFNVPQGTFAYLGEVWCVDDASPTLLSLVATRFHDQVAAISYQVVDGSTLAPVNRSTRLSSPGIDQPIFPSDVLQVLVDGTAGDNVNATLMLYYANIPGISARLHTFEAVMAAAGNQVGIKCSTTPGAGDWGATAALNASDDRLHANTDYALLGFTSTTPLAAVSIQGIDTGNLKVGGPVIADGDHDSSLFVDFARAYGQPLIPVINSNNAGSTNVQSADPTAGATDITVVMVELPRGI